MLSQHLVTKPVFDALFEDYSFAEHNPVSRVMQGMLDALEGQNLAAEVEPLERFYESVRLRAAGIDNAEGKQKIVNELYEKFFKTAFPRAAESLGIVYTPVEIVDFIIRSVEHLLGEEFGASISDAGVHVLDPFTGTGTFIVRLLESGLIHPDDLLRKYPSELHANEILLLAYYIAAINIEATYHGIATRTDPNAGYVPFDGIVLTDTFQMTEDSDTMDEVMFPANNARAEAQKNLDIRVIIANPPYSVGQTSQNDANQNLKYPTLDAAIETTYAAASSAALKRNLYDSYVRAIRWASDRIKDRGIIGFVTNGGFIDSNSADGLRQTLVDEFTSIYVYNLRGNQRTAGELSRQEGGKIFGGGSRNTVAITLLVKHPDHPGRAVVRYRDIGDYLTREQKLDIIADSQLGTLDWQELRPNEAGDWINQRTSSFATLSPMAGSLGGDAVFRLSGPGLSTNRDPWLYGSSVTAVVESARRTTSAFNEAVATLRKVLRPGGDCDFLAREVANATGNRVSWSRGLLARLVSMRELPMGQAPVVKAAYRPFNTQLLYLEENLIEAFGSVTRTMAPERGRTLCIAVTGPSATDPFSVMMTDLPPNLHYMNSGHVFPRFTYEPLDSADAQGAFDLRSDETDVVAGYRRVDNITDGALTDYRNTYGSAVTKDDVFYYVYGLLHSPDYRTTFAADLKKMLPRIPKVASADDFRAFVAAGRELATLHIGYESVTLCPLQITGEPGPGVVGDAKYDWYRVDKMRFGGAGKAKDRSTVIYNSHLTVAGLPEEAYEYLLGSRSAIEWILERYQVKTDKASGIVNDPNDWSREVGDPRYILDLLARIVTVSVETVRIVKGLPELDLNRP